MKDMKLGPLTKVLRPSPTLAVTMKAKALQKEGRDIIGFGAGEPDFDTPDNIKTAAIRAIQEGFTKYTPVGGIDELKDAIIEKLRKDNGLAYKRSQIVVSTGAKHTLFNMAQVLFGQGDEVIIPAPYWVSYPDIVLLADATPVIVDGGESDGFKLTPANLKKAITEKTKAIILNSPSNPTGAAYNLDELKGLAEVLKGTEIIVISDDIYEKVVYDDFRFSNIANVSEEMKEKTIVVNGLSKSHAMTGWRMGYAAGPDNVIAAMTEIQSQSTSNATSFVQKAAIEALLGDQSFIPKMVAEFKKRRDAIVGALNGIPGITCATPPGAFYVFPKVSALYGKNYEGKTISTSNDFSEFLLEAANVAVVPGGAFGNDDCIRLSYATSMELILEGMKRTAAAVSKLD
jgi:aspartate aminotransferase